MVEFTGGNMLVKNYRKNVQFTISFYWLYWLLHQAITWILFYKNPAITNLRNWNITNDFDSLPKVLNYWDDESRTYGKIMYMPISEPIKRKSTEGLGYYQSLSDISSINNWFFFLFNGCVYSSHNHVNHRMEFKQTWWRKLSFLFLNSKSHLTLKGYEPIYYRLKTRLLWLAMQIQFAMGARAFDTDPYHDEIVEIEKATGKSFWPVTKVKHKSDPLLTQTMLQGVLYRADKNL